MKDPFNAAPPAASRAEAVEDEQIPDIGGLFKNTKPEFPWEIQS